MGMRERERGEGRWVEKGGSDQAGFLALTGGHKVHPPPTITGASGDSPIAWGSQGLPIE